MQGFIVKLVAGDYTIFSNQKTYKCKARGLFRNQQTSPICGDECEFIYDEVAKHGWITKIYPRKNCLLRPSVANIDLALIIMSTIQPQYDALLVDKLMIQCAMENIEPVLCISKCEFLDNELDILLKNYEFAGYKVIRFSSHQNIQIQKIENLIQNKKVVLCGQSAVGKSSLINILSNEKIKSIGNYSEKLGRGKHQTREVEFLNLCGGFIADTPGFSRLELNIEPTSLARIFYDFDKYAQNCKYNTCLHIHEPNCQVKAKVEDGTIHQKRYENYLKLQKELKEGKTTWRKKG